MVPSFCVENSDSFIGISTEHYRQGLQTQASNSYLQVFAPGCAGERLDHAGYRLQLSLASCCPSPPSIAAPIPAPWLTPLAIPQRWWSCQEYMIMSEASVQHCFQYSSCYGWNCFWRLWYFLYFHRLWPWSFLAYCCQWDPEYRHFYK